MTVRELFQMLLKSDLDLDTEILEEENGKIIGFETIPVYGFDRYPEKYPRPYDRYKVVITKRSGVNEL